jgi:hypothetical protein
MGENSMGYLSETMWAATADPPPTAIDLDRLIDGHRRGVRRRREVGLVAGLVVLVALVAALPVLVTGAHTGRSAPLASSASIAMPSASPPTITCYLLRPGVQDLVDSPAAPCGPMETQLNRAVIAAVHRVAPGAELSSITVSPLTNGSTGEYNAELVFTAAGRRLARLGVTVVPKRSGFMVSTDCSEMGHSSGDTCSTGRWAGGTYAAMSNPKTPDGWVEVALAKTDGTRVELRVDAQGGKPALSNPLTVDQMVALGQDPGLTMAGVSPDPTPSTLPSSASPGRPRCHSARCRNS